MEAYARLGALLGAGEIEKLGHTVKLMSPQFVIPYRKGKQE